MTTPPSTKSTRHATSSDPLIQQIDVSTLKFKPKVPKQAAHEIYCHVCFQFHKLHASGIDRKLPYPDKGLDIITCYGCELTVHHYCYGRKTPINEVKEHSKEIMRMFVCDKCQEIGPTGLKECLLCLQKGGALKKVSNDGYVHITCALFSEMYCIDDFEQMSVHASSKLDKRVSKQGKPCEYCKKTNNLFKCHNTACLSNTHIYCALEAGVETPPDEENKSGWNFKLGNDENPTKIVVDFEDPSIQKVLEEVYLRLREVSDKGVSDQDKPKEESKTDSGVKNKKKSKKGKGEHGEESTMVTEEDEKLIKEISGDIKEKIKDVVKAIPLTNPPRGGSVTLYCENHKPEELYCVCNQPYEAERAMVACDCCDNWFDYGCLGFSKEQEDAVKGLKMYFCKKCRLWRTYVRNFLEKGPEASEELNLQHEVLDQLHCVPKDISKFTIAEFIIVCLMIQLKLSRQLETEVIEKGGSVELVLEKLLDSAKFIPFNLNGIAISFIYKSFLGHGIDLLLEKVSPLDPMENIEGLYVPDKNEFDDERASKLQEIVQHLSAIFKIYKDHGLQKSPTAINVKTLLGKYEWILDVWKTFGQDNAKGNVSGEKVNELLKRANSLGLDRKIPEQEYLESLGTNVSDSNSTVRKAITDKTSVLRSKIAELEDVEAQNLPLEKALKALEDIETICKAALEVKPSLTELEDIIGKDQGEEKMEAEDNVRSVKNEIAKAKELERRWKGKKTRAHDDTEKKVTEVCENLVILPEMEHLIEEYKKGKTMQLKLQYYLRQSLKEAKPENGATGPSEEKTDMEEEEDKEESVAEDKKNRESGKKIKGSGKKSKESSKSAKTNKTNAADNKMEVDTQDEEVLMEKSEEGGDIGTVEDVEQLLKESEGLDNRFLKDKKALKDMLHDIAKLKKKVKDSLGSTTDVKELEVIRKEARRFRLAFKEKDEVREKCRLYREKSQEVRNRSCNLDELSNMKEEFGKFFKDTRIQNELKNRVDKLKKLEKDAEKILNKKTFSREDVEKKVQAIIAEMQEQKIKLNHKSDLESLQKSLSWLESLYKFRKQCIAAENKGINGHSMEIEAEKDQEAEGEQQQNEEKKEDKEEEALSVDTLVKACELKDADWEDIYKKSYEEFKDILNQGQKEKHRDQRIDRIFKDHIRLYCEIEANSLFNGREKLDIDDVDRICEIGEKFKVDAPGDLYARAAEAQEKYNTWIQEVQEVVSAEGLVYALDEDCRGHEEELSKLREKSKRLVSEYNVIGIESQEENKILRSVWRLLEWSGKGREMLKMIKETQKASLEAIEDFVACAKDLNIPSDSWLYKETNKALDELDGLKEEFEETKKTRKLVKKKIRGIYKEYDSQKRKKDLEKLGKEKPKLEKMREIEKKLKESSLYVVQGEIDEMQGEIKKCSTWVDKVKAFIEKYGKDLKKTKEEGWGQFTLKDEDINKITGELSSIKSEMRNLVVRDSGVEEELKRLEWFFRTTLLVEKKLEKGNTIKTWLKLKKLAEKDKKSEKKLTETELYTEILKEIEKYEQIVKKMDELKFKENLLMQNWWMTQGANVGIVKRETVNKEDVENLLKEIDENCKIGFGADAKHLKELLHSGDETVKIFNGVINKEYGTKPALDVVQNLLRRFSSTIIQYPEPEKTLEGYLQKAEDMWGSLQKFASGAEKIDAVFDKYQECPVYIEEAEKLCAEYTKGKELAEKVDKMFTEADSQGLKDIDQALEELNAGIIDFDGKLEEAKKKLYRLRVKYVKRISEKEEVAEEERIKLDALKTWRDEAGQALTSETDKEDVQEDLDWIKSFMEKIEEKVKEVQSVKEVEKLTEEMNIACGFVDISEVVAQHKDRLEKEEEEKIEEEKAESDIELIKDVDDEKKGTPPVEILDEPEIVEENEAAGQDELLGKRNFEDREAGARKPEEAAQPLGQTEAAEIEIDEDEEEDIEVIQKKVKHDLEKESKHEVRNEGVKKAENARREQARKQIVEALKENRHFNDVEDRHKNIAKRLELRLFLQLGPRARQYAKSLEEVCWLLAFLNCNQGISRELIDKDFELDFIEELISKFSTAKGKKDTQVKKSSLVQKQQVAAKKPQTTLIEEEKVVPQQGAGKPVEKSEEKDEGTISVSSHDSFVGEIAQKEQKQTKNIQLTQQIEDDIEEVEEIDEEEDIDDEEGEDLDEDEDEEDEDEEDEDEFDEDEEDYEDDNGTQEVVNLESEEDEAKQRQTSQPGQMLIESSKEAEENLPVYEKGSILRIYEGKVNYQELLNRSVSLTASSGLRHCYLFTTEDSQFVRKFPKLPNELNIAGKSGQKDAIDYIEDLHINWMNNPNREKPYIVGWIEAKRDVQADIVRLGEELLERKKVALIKYSDFAEMYLLHPAMLKKDMPKQFDWKIQTVAGQRKPKAALLFMIHKKNRGVTRSFEKIQPQFVGMSDQTEEKGEGQDKSAIEVLEVEEVSEAVSPLTSLADEDFMSGQGLGQMQFGNMGQHMGNMMNMVGMGGAQDMMNLMAASMMGGQMGGMMYNQEIISMMQAAEAMARQGNEMMTTGFGGQGRTSQKTSSAWQAGAKGDGNKRGGHHQNVILDDEEEDVEEYDDVDEDDEEDEEEEEDEEDEEEVEDDDEEEVEDEEDLDEEEIEHMNRVMEVMKRKQAQDKAKQASNKPRVIEEINIDDDDEEEVKVGKEEDQAEEIEEQISTQRIEESQDKVPTKRQEAEEIEDDDDDEEEIMEVDETPQIGSGQFLQSHYATNYQTVMQNRPRGAGVVEVMETEEIEEIVETKDDVPQEEQQRAGEEAIEIENEGPVEQAQEGQEQLQQEGEQESEPDLQQEVNQGGNNEEQA